jgi:hypothetical protein
MIAVNRDSEGYTVSVDGIVIASGLTFEAAQWMQDEETSVTFDTPAPMDVYDAITRGAVSCS